MPTDGNSLPPDAPVPPEGGAPSPGSRRNGERDLIDAALAQASPRGDGGSAVALLGDLPPGDMFPGYELVREVHRGGQGAVYLAIQKATKRRVAIKVMHGGPFQGSSGRARFEREVQVLGQLNHPNIVRIHDSGVTADGSCFYVMDYVSGRSLDEVIGESKKQPIEETLKLFGKICEAVSSAHLKGVIHRDLKPANIRINAAGEPVVVDFGLAKTAVPDVTEESHPRLMTMTGQFIGSLPWASPEQAEGAPDKIDVRTDVYSLGVILYQMLTGKFPYEVIGNMRDVLDNILRAEPARPSTVRRQINDEVETIVLKCLSKERERRYQSAGELGRDIRHYLSGEPIEAKRDSGWYLVSKTLRRHRMATGFSAALLAAIVIFAGVVSVAWRAEARERQRADANFDLVREQARTMMFDFNQAIANLRGGTPARKLLFDKAQEALGRLRDQAGNKTDDVGFRRELADATDLVGDIRIGLLYLPKIGDTAAAKKDYEEARAVRERLLKEKPNDYRSHGDMAESHKRTAQVLATELKFKDAADEAAKGIAEYDTAVKLAGGEPAATVSGLMDRRAVVVFARADAMANLADAPGPGIDADRAAKDAGAAFDEAEAYWSHRAASDPGDATAARWLGVCRDHQAAVECTRGTILAARAKALLKTDGAKAAQVTAEAVGRYGEARTLAQGALSDFERVYRSHPENAEWRRDCYLALYNVGITHMLSGNAYKALGDEASATRAKQEWLAAAGEFEKAQAIVDELAASDASNLRARRDQVVVQNKRGNMLRDAGSLEAAEALFMHSLEVRRDLNQTDPSPRARRDVAVGEYKLGQVLELEAGVAGAAGDAARQRELLKRAEGLYVQAVTDFDANRGADGKPADPGAGDEARGALARCREAMLKEGGP